MGGASWPQRDGRLCSQLIPRSPPAPLPILTRRPGLHKRAHPFTLPLKDDKQCIPRVLYRAASSCPALGLISPVGSSLYLIFFLSITIFSISLSLSLHLVLLIPINS